MHVLALWPQLPPRLAERAGSVLHATLRPPASGKSPAAQDEAPSPPTSPRRAATAPAAVPPAPTFPPAPTAAERIGPPADSTGAAPDRSAPVGATTATASTGEAAAGAAGGTAPLASIAPESDAQRQYRLALAREARRFKRYPERARLDGVGGTVEVRVEHELGRAPVARLARSSGHAALDAAALDMMRLAAPRARVPESLRGRAFAVVLPVVFDIEED